MAEQFPTESLSESTAAPERPPTPPHADRAWWSIYLPVAIFVCALLAIGSLLIFVLTDDLFSTSTADGTGKTKGTVTAKRDQRAYRQSNSATSDEAESATDTAAIEALQAEEERNIRLAKLERFANLRDQVERDLQHLAAEMSNWQTVSKALLDEDSGRHIASDSNFVEQFVPIYQRKQITQEDYESFQRRMTQLSVPIAAAEEEDSGYLPSVNLLAELKTLQGEITARARAVEDSRKDAEAIQRFAANRPAAETTLRTAMEEIRKRQQEIRLAEVAAARRKAEEETTARMAEEESKQGQLRREVKLAQIANENARLKGTKRDLDDATAQEVERRRLAAQKAQLERDFQRDLQQIRSLLRPFITSGMTQPKGRQFVTADQEGPVSLASLRGTGALEPTAKGHDLLFWITSANQLNDRDLGAFPDYRSGVYDKRRSLAKVKQAQELLIKYGDLMVTKKMLAK